MMMTMTAVFAAATQIPNGEKQTVISSFVVFVDFWFSLECQILIIDLVTFWNVWQLQLLYIIPFRYFIGLPVCGLSSDVSVASLLSVALLPFKIFTVFQSDVSSKFSL